MSCSAVDGPAITTIYYDNYGHCYRSATSTRRIDGVNLVGTGSITLTFHPKPGGPALPLARPAHHCGDDNSASAVSITGPGVSPVVATFDLTGIDEETWGWDFETEGEPSSITIKVRVRRTGAPADLSPSAS